MENGYYCVHYTIVAHSKVRFTVQAERAVFVELVEGYARIQEDGGTENTLYERELYLLESLNPVLLSDIGCSFKVCGRHKLFSFDYREEMTDSRMFQLIDEDSKVTFVLEKNFQIIIFHREKTRPVMMELAHNQHEVLGPVLHCETNPGYHYYLPPFSHFLIRNNYGPINKCTMKINEPTEKFDFFICPYNVKTFINMRDILYDIELRYSLRRTDLPKVLILGNRSVTEISFCHSILNNAFENHRKLVYVDLNVRENSNGIPGSLRIIQVSGRRTVDDRGCHKSELFLGNDENLFSFGYVDPESNIKLYYLLLNRLADLASQMNDQKRVAYTCTIIDMCDSLSSDLIAVRRAIDAFRVNTVVVVGNEELYQCLGKFDLPRYCLQKFIPETGLFQPPRRNLHNSVIKEYLHWAQNVFLVKFSDIKIYEIISEGVADDIESSTFINVDEVRTVPVACGEHLENHLLGVSECSTEVQELPVTRVKYFLFILKVDMEKETLQIKSPRDECPTGAILIKGDIKLLRQNES